MFLFNANYLFLFLLFIFLIIIVKYRNQVFDKQNKIDMLNEKINNLTNNIKSYEENIDEKEELLKIDGLIIDLYDCQNNPSSNSCKTQKDGTKACRSRLKNCNYIKNLLMDNKLAKKRLEQLGGVNYLENQKIGKFLFDTNILELSKF